MINKNLQKGEIELHCIGIDSYWMHWLTKKNTIKYIKDISYESALEKAKRMDYEVIRVYSGDFLMEIIIKRRFEMKNSEKIKDLLDRGMIVEYSSEDEDPILILIADEQGNCVYCEKDDFTDEYDCNLTAFDEDKKPKIKIYRRKYKRIGDGEEVYNMFSEQQEMVVGRNSYKDTDYYDTDDTTQNHITDLAPLWYVQKEETITIGGRNYLKDDVEDALKDLEEV